MRRLHLCYGHRVLGHEGKCASLHGHNAHVEVYATSHPSSANALDKLGRVVDFGVLKERIGSWIEEHWDHTMLLWSKDERAVSALNLCGGPKMPFLLPYNPTAENLAAYLLWEIAPPLLADTGIVVQKIVWWETQNCAAQVEVSREDPALLKKYEQQ